MTELTLVEFHKIMAIPLHYRPLAEWPMWLRAKIRCGAYILSARLRVDESSLRKREMDAIPKLLKQIEAAKEANPALQEQAAKVLEQEVLSVVESLDT